MLEYIRPTPKRRKKTDAFIPTGEPLNVLYARGSLKDINKETQIAEFERRYLGLPYQLHEETAKGDKDRPRLMYLLANLPKGSSIYVVAIDRLARSTRSLLDIVHKAKEREITFKSLREGDMDVMSPIVLAVLAAVAEMEKFNLSSRVKSRIKAYKEENNLPANGWGRGLTAMRAEAEGKPVVHRNFRQVSPEFKAALPDIKKLKAKGLTHSEVAEYCRQKYKVNFTKYNISKLLNHGHG